MAARGREGGGEEDDLEPPTAAARASQRRRLGRRPPRPPASSAATIVALEPPPSSSIIAVAFSSSGCDATMRTSGGKKAVPQPWPQRVPSRVSLPLPRRVEEAPGHRCDRYGGGGRSPLLLVPPTEGPHGGGSGGGGGGGASMVEGRWGGRSCQRCLAFLVAGVVAQQLSGWTNRCAKKTRAKLPFPTMTVYRWIGVRD